MTSTPSNDRARWVAPALAYLGLLALQARLLWGAWGRWDLRLWDGSWYWGWGRDIATSLRFPSFENGPFYCGFYALFHLLLDDPFAIFFAHRLVTLWLIASLLFWLLLRLFSAPVAWLLSAYGLLLFGDGGVGQYTVRFFVVIPLLLGYLAAFSPSPWACAGALGGFALAALARPEFGSAMPLLLLAWIAYEVGSGRWRAMSPSTQAKSLVALAVGAVVSVVFVAKLSNTSKRSWLAFGQHYSYGYKLRHPKKSRLDPWLHWKRYLKRSFPKARTVGQAARTNPSAFLEHVAWNAELLPKSLDYALKPAFPPGSGWGRWVVGSLHFFYLFVALMLLWLLWIRKQLRASREPGEALPQPAHPPHPDDPQTPAQAASLTPRLVLVMLCSLAPVVLSALLIYPSPFYMFAFKVVALVLLGFALEKAWSSWGGKEVWVIGGLFILVWMAFPMPFSTPKPRHVLPTVRAIPPIQGAEKYGLIADSAISFCTYSRDPRCQPIELLWGAMPKDIQGFLRRRNVKLLLVGGRLMANVGPAWRAYLRGLQAAPARYGWRLHARTRAFVIYVKGP